MEENPAQAQSQPVAQPTTPSVAPMPQASQVNQVAATQSVQPQNYSVAQSEHHTGKSFLKVLLVLIFIIGATAAIVYGGYMLMGAGKVTTVAPKNANVFVEPTKPIGSPTPSVYQTNPNDTTDNAINQDTQITNTELNNLDTSLNNVDQSLLDKQTNLQ